MGFIKQRYQYLWDTHRGEANKYFTVSSFWIGKPVLAICGVCAVWGTSALWSAFQIGPAVVHNLLFGIEMILAVRKDEAIMHSLADFWVSLSIIGFIIADRSLDRCPHDFPNHREILLIHYSPSIGIDFRIPQCCEKGRENKQKTCNGCIFAGNQVFTENDILRGNCAVASGLSFRPLLLSFSFPFWLFRFLKVFGAPRWSAKK